MRSLRRTFAAPLVLILAPIATGACESQSHVGGGTAPNPPPPEQQSHNPPAPDPDPLPPIKNPPPPTTPPVPVDQPPGNPPPPILNPPAPQPMTNAKDRHWNISKQGTKCQAFDDDACKDPNRKPGDPIPPCNPPSPIDYPCQKQVAATDYKIVRHDGDTKCFTDPFQCPANAKCKPTPPPVEVACPK